VRVNSIKEDLSGQLWAGTSKGLYRFAYESNRWNKTTYDIQDKARK
jgi:ligand-binding sensor domain-containing protein